MEWNWPGMDAKENFWRSHHITVKIVCDKEVRAEYGRMDSTKPQSEEDQMKLYSLVGLSAAITMLTVPALAAEMDMSKMTCKDVAAMEPGTMAAMAVWMSGFAHGKADNMVVDTDKMAANAQMVKDLCGKAPDATLRSVMEQMSKM
jgi:acid stress chaperone HdeB